MCAPTTARQPFCRLYLITGMVDLALLWLSFCGCFACCSLNDALVRGRCAYNGVNGYPMCMSPMISSVLRDEFNFTARPENYVVTDSGALDFMVSRFHRFNDTGEDAAVAALHAGVDLNSGGVYSSAPSAFGSDRSRNAVSKRPRSV